VVMARQVPLVFHYAQRKVVWFPPSSNPQLLMDGIRRLHVDFIVVVRRTFSFYLPPETDCFTPLIVAFPNAFQLETVETDFRVFRVTDASRSEPPEQGVATELRHQP
jgi:hypothetical protein